MVRESHEERDALYENYCQGMRAIKSGLTSEFEELQKKDASFPHETTWLDRHWLTHAIAAHAIACIEWMIQQKVALNYFDDEGYSPLRSAVESAPINDTQVVRLLLKSGANPSPKTNPYNSAIHCAASLNRADILEVMETYQADLNLVLEDLGSYYTPLDFVQDGDSPPNAYEFLKSRGCRTAYELELQTHKTK
jgi:Ankyrin repeat